MIITINKYFCRHERQHYWVVHCLNTNTGSEKGTQQFQSWIYGKSAEDKALKYYWSLK